MFVFVDRLFFFSLRWGVGESYWNSNYYNLPSCKRKVSQLSLSKVYFGEVHSLQNKSNIVIIRPACFAYTNMKTYCISLEPTELKPKHNIKKSPRNHNRISLFCNNLLLRGKKTQTIVYFVTQKHCSRNIAELTRAISSQILAKFVLDASKNFWWQPLTNHNISRSHKQDLSPAKHSAQQTKHHPAENEINCSVKQTQTYN